MDTSGNDTNSTCPSDHQSSGIKVVSVRWREVGVYFTITSFVIIAGFAKLGKRRATGIVYHRRLSLEQNEDEVMSKNMKIRMEVPKQ